MANEIKLGPEASIALAELLLSPPKPNEKLLRALQAHAAMIVESQVEPDPEIEAILTGNLFDLYE